MDSTERCRTLAQEILFYFREGITIDNHTRRYIDTCFPGTPLTDLADLIGDTPDLDAAPLMDLIFFPDEILQIQLEPLLEKEPYDVEDETRVIELLCEEDIRTTLRVAGNRTRVPIRIPGPVLDPFVHRLRISRRIPARLVDTLRNVFTPGESDRLMVILRNTRFSFSPPVTDFLDCFFKGMDPNAADFHECTQFMLALLDEQKHGVDPCLLIREKKDVLLRARHAAIEFEDQLRRGNMEILMHQGIRAPETSLADTEKKIALIDRIEAGVAHGKKVPPI